MLDHLTSLQQSSLSVVKTECARYTSINQLQRPVVLCKHAMITQMQVMSSAEKTRLISMAAHAQHCLL